MSTSKPAHNHNSELPESIATQAAVHSFEEAQIRADIEATFGDLCEEVSFPELKSRIVMALLLVKYEDRQLGESKPNFIERRNDIMATAIKKKLTEDLAAKKTQRAAAPAKVAPAAEKPAKAAKAGKAAPAAEPAEKASRGRAAGVNKIKINPEGGESKLNANSERAQVLELIKKAGAKGITIEDLDAAYAEVCAANETEPKKTRGFVLKLLEKNWVIVLS